MTPSTPGRRGWIIDVDGCLVRAARYGGDGGQPIEGSAEFIALLDRVGEPYVVCTNASGNPPDTYAAGLRAEGIPVDDAHFETAGSMTADLIARRHPGEAVAVVGSPAFADTVRSYGVDVAVGERARSARAVAVGDGVEFRTADLDAAALAVDAGAAFYSTVGQRWFHGGMQKGITSSALIAAGIAWTTGVQPEVTGKPSRELGLALAARMGVAPEDVVVVGDALAEVELARAIGGTSCLVLTGGVDRATADALPAERRPDAVFEDIGGVLARTRAELGDV